MRNLSLLFIAFLLLQFTSFAQDGWFEQTSGTTLDLKSVYFVNSDVGWAVGGDVTPPFDGIILKTTNGGETWAEQQTGLPFIWYSVCFIDLNTGYIAGRDYSGGPPTIGIVAKTTDGGLNWSQTTGGMCPEFYSVCFTDLTNGWAAGEGGQIMFTTDGGANWNYQTSGAAAVLWDIYFIDSNNGIIVGGDYLHSNGTLLKTTNGGTDWSIQLSGVIDGLYSVDFVDQNIGWVASLDTIFKTTDGGFNWLTSSNQIGGRSIDFIDQNNGWIVGRRRGAPENGYISNTTDGGANWLWQYQYVPHGLTGVHFINQNIGWVVGDQGTILKTINGGIPVELTSFTATTKHKEVTLSWSTATETNNSGFEIERKRENSDWTKIGFVEGHGTTTEPQMYSFIDKNVGVGIYFYRLKQIDFDGTFEYSQIVELEVGIPNEYLLLQNYPNPFNPSTKIKYSIPQLSNVVLKVFDILGNEIETLVNEEKQIGTYELTWNASSLPSGVYFYRLQAGDFIQTKKMILTK